ncbi:MAG TPA: sensor histidine kinase [Chitinophagaceae bacterium]|nr:sensor histidine kinase [Chitinophagaceae bacterium]
MEKISEIQSNYEKSLLNTRLEMQEATFQHISREIHDNISLSLTLAKLNLNTMNLDSRENAEMKLGSSIELLTESISQLRDLSKSLDADLIEKNGLLSAVGTELDRICRATDFQVRYSVTGTPVYMNSGTELIVFRIVQEALNNVIRHARASEIRLRFHYDKEWFLAEICDDGVGFSGNVPLNGKSGLRNMSARAELLGGSVEIVSDPRNGTRVSCRVPLATNR